MNDEGVVIIGPIVVANGETSEPFVCMTETRGAVDVSFSYKKRRVSRRAKTLARRLTRAPRSKQSRYS